jgi:hypothetical protein
MKEGLKFFEGHFRPEDIDNSKKSIDNILGSD